MPLSGVEGKGEGGAELFKTYGVFIDIMNHTSFHFYARHKKWRGIMLYPPNF